jgi:DNA invertase Pin-like site-specific DNA recombinase
MLWNRAFETQAAKPAIGKIEMHLLAKPPFRPDAIAIADQQHAGHEFRIDRGPASMAVERRQLEQLRGAGCSKIYREKVTGARADRRQLLDMLKHLAPGDVVTVTRIDRLARSTFDLFAIVKEIVDAKAQFRSLAEPWADTGTSTGRLMIAVLGGLADVERDLIRTRTAGGRSRAQKRGQHMGRPRN